MKRNKFIKYLEQNSCLLVREAVDIPYTRTQVQERFLLYLDIQILKRIFAERFAKNLVSLIY